MNAAPTPRQRLVADAGKGDNRIQATQQVRSSRYLRRENILTNLGEWPAIAHRPPETAASPSFPLLFLR